MRRVLTDEFLRQHCLEELKRPLSTTGVSLLKNNSTRAMNSYSSVVPSSNPVSYFNTINTNISNLRKTAVEKKKPLHKLSLLIDEVEKEIDAHNKEMESSRAEEREEEREEDDERAFQEAERDRLEMLKPFEEYAEETDVNFPETRPTRAEQDERDLQNFLDTGRGIDYTDVIAQNQGLSLISRDQRTRAPPERFEPSYE